LLFGGKEFMSEKSYKKEAIKKGVSFGTCLAMVISWSINKSILWAIIHGILGWLYVIYYIIKY
jgi:hypothetical protein